MMPSLEPEKTLKGFHGGGVRENGRWNWLKSTLWFCVLFRSEVLWEN